MNRRDFLATVLGATAAAAVLPQIEALASTLPNYAVDDFTAAPWQATYRAVHVEAFRLYRAAMERHGLPVEPRFVQTGANGIGRSFYPTGEVLAHQCCVSLHPSIDMRGSIEPAMAALADRAALYGLDRYGAMGQPKGVTYAATLGPLRMIVQYDIGIEENIMRFDVLGGASPQGQVIVRRRVQADLKRRLQARRRTLRLQASRLPA